MALHLEATSVDSILTFKLPVVLVSGSYRSLACSRLVGITSPRKEKPKLHSTSKHCIRLESFLVLFNFHLFAVLCSIELWPGFITSILPYEKTVMLCLDVSHRVLRTDTVLDFLYDLKRKGSSDFYGAARKALIGEIVLTR